MPCRVAQCATHLCGQASRSGAPAAARSERARQGARHAASPAARAAPRHCGPAPLCSSRCLPRISRKVKRRACGAHRPGPPGGASAVPPRPSPQLASARPGAAAHDSIARAGAAQHGGRRTRGAARESVLRPLSLDGAPRPGGAAAASGSADGRWAQLAGMGCSHAPPQEGQARFTLCLWVSQLVPYSGLEKVERREQLSHSCRMTKYFVSAARGGALLGHARKADGQPRNVPRPIQRPPRAATLGASAAAAGWARPSG